MAIPRIPVIGLILLGLGGTRAGAPARARGAFLAFLLVLPLGAAGCLSPPAADFPSPSDSPPPSLDPVPSIPNILFEGCQGVAAGLNLPAEWVSMHVPRAFGPSSVIPFFATVGVSAYDCPRAVYGNQTFENVGLVWAMTNAIPRNESWRGTGLNKYDFDFFVSNPFLADVLATGGFPAQVSTFTREGTSRIANESVETWTFRSESSSYELRVPFRDVAHTFHSNNLYHHWLGDGPFSRLDIRSSDTWTQFVGLTGVTVVVTGESGFKDVVGAGAIVMPATALQEARLELMPVKGVFK